MDMKKNIILIALLGLGLVSCYKSQLDPISGIFPAPTEVKASEFTTASATSVKGEQGRLIDVDLKASSATIHLAIVGNKYYLSENVYLGALEAVATNGTFIAAKTTVNGLGAKEGRITVSRIPVDTEKKTYSLDDIYTIKAVLFLVDGAPVKFEWTGKLEFHPDPVIGDIIVENTMADAASATEAGKVKHLITLTQDDVKVATFELFCEPDADITGTYVCKEFAEMLGESLIIANGYNIPDWGISGGSFYMKDGARVDINAGELVTVVKAGDKLYSFTGNGFTFLAKF